ncbi:MAG: hypothetical protein JNM93_10700 [Bacteriovoracaceae bacterium]|nr:hypothetical protein [Bacteriovoracaceae bacterium]
MGESDLELVIDLKNAGYTQIQAEEMIRVLDKKMKHDFATKSDIKDVRGEIKDLSHAMELRFQRLESSIDLRFEKLGGHIIQKVGVMLTAGLTLTISLLSFILKN